MNFPQLFPDSSATRAHPAPLGSLLLADDDPAFRTSTAGVLKEAGYLCGEAESGGAARAQLLAQECDLLIADIHMPGNMNLELLDVLAELPHAPSVLLVTGRPTVETASRAVQAHVVGYLIKPIEAEQLVRTVQREVRAHAIRRFIQQRRARAELMLEQMRHLEEAVQSVRAGGHEQELQAYLAMFCENVVYGLRDWTDFVGVASARKATETDWQRLAAARPFQLTEVLRETVQVLERTKFSFKSKELADLRKRLELLLTEPAAAGARGS